MGTLTGDTPALVEHCDHKLPSSCRLTATALCCACQDKRAHSPRYSTYIDGIGLVNRGTRWQRYCYFCREFWSNRVAATDPPMDPSDTRIPEVPDQTSFLDAWFTYHRGYRIETDQAGEEQRVHVRLEKPWRDTDPGTLPILDESQRLMILQSQAPASISATAYTPVDSTLDSLMIEAEREETLVTDDLAGVERNRQRLSLREERRRLREVHARVDVERSLEDADRRCTLATLRKQRAVRELDAAEAEIRNAQAARRLALRDYRHVQDSQRTQQQREEFHARAAQRFTRVWGTRQDMERQGSEYTSPLTSLFTRAYERYHVAEEVRAEERASTGNLQRHQEFLANLTQQHYPALFNSIEAQVALEFEQQGPVRTLDDEQDNRPPPKSEEELNVRLVCRVCLQQVADTAVLPCGHLILCLHCADIVVPPRPNDHTQPAQRSACPLCRKNIVKRVRIYTS